MLHNQNMFSNLFYLSFLMIPISSQVKPDKNGSTKEAEYFCFDVRSEPLTVPGDDQTPQLDAPNDNPDASFCPRRKTYYRLVTGENGRFRCGHVYYSALRGRNEWYDLNISMFNLTRSVEFVTFLSLLVLLIIWL